MEPWIVVFHDPIIILHHPVVRHETLLSQSRGYREFPLECVFRSEKSQLETQESGIFWGESAVPYCKLRVIRSVPGQGRFLSG